MGGSQVLNLNTQHDSWIRVSGMEQPHNEKCKTASVVALLLTVMLRNLPFMKSKKKNVYVEPCTKYQKPSFIDLCMLPGGGPASE